MALIQVTREQLGTSATEQDQQLFVGYVGVILRRRGINPDYATRKETQSAIDLLWNDGDWLAKAEQIDQEESEVNGL